jgi:hypothetical protein
MSAAYQSTFPKQNGFKAILPDANDSPVNQLEEWKSKVEENKELLEECKEKAKRRSENTQQQDYCPRLRHERNNIGRKLWPCWALS